MINMRQLCTYISRIQISRCNLISCLCRITLKCTIKCTLKNKYTRYSSVSDMLDELGWPPLSQTRQEAQLILFYKIINGLAQVPVEGVLIEAYKDTRRKHNIKFRHWSYN